MKVNYKVLLDQRELILGGSLNLKISKKLSYALKYEHEAKMYKSDIDIDL
jgi:hypothetical protein